MERSEFKGGSERRQGFSVKRILHVVMGLLWMGMGVFITFFSKNQVITTFDLEDPLVKGFGIICFLYGGFRIFRGISKKFNS